MRTAPNPNYFLILLYMPHSTKPNNCNGNCKRPVEKILNELLIKINNLETRLKQLESKLPNDKLLNLL